MNILIMGPAGSGKGTMSRYIMDRYKIPHISSGELFRRAIQDQTGLGQLAKNYIDHGLLVPDDMTILMIKERISQEDCKNGFLLDGFPRTMIQTGAFEHLLEEMDTKLDVVINLNVPSYSLAKRITGRRICPECGDIYNIYNHKPKVEGVCDRCGHPLTQRSDDTLEQFEIRMKEYEHLTKPVIDFYTGKGDVVSIDASLDVELVWRNLEKALDKIHND